MQIEHFHLNVVPRTLQGVFNNRTSQASRFKKAKVSKLSKNNKKRRVQYGLEHENHTIENYFQYVHFSDEAYFDPDQTYNERVLREEGEYDFNVS